MTWATARAALVELLDGLTIAVTGDEGAEELRAYEFTPPGEVGPDDVPCAFVPGPEREWTFLPGGLLQSEVNELSVIVYLGPPNADAEALERRRERWVEAIATVVIGNQTLGGEISAIYGGRVGRLVRFGTDERPVAWGFEVTLQVAFHENKTAGA